MVLGRAANAFRDAEFSLVLDFPAPPILREGDACQTYQRGRIDPKRSNFLG